MGTNFAGAIEGPVASYPNSGIPFVARHGCLALQCSRDGAIALPAPQAPAFWAQIRRKLRTRQIDKSLSNQNVGPVPT